MAVVASPVAVTMDLTPPPRELRIEPGDWRTMDGREPDEQLCIRPAGPLLSASREGWVVVTGWRDLPNKPVPTWTVAAVRQSAVVDDDDEQPPGLAEPR